MASGQTTVFYGSWGLSRCQTLEFRQEPVFDDSGTDLMYYRFTVRVRGWMHNRNGYNNWCQLNAPDSKRSAHDTSAAYSHIGMRIQLPPRQSFVMRTGADATGLAGGYILLYAEPHPDSNPEGITHLDVNNGPRCKEFVIKRIVGDDVFEVEAEFEVCKVECSLSELPPSGSSGTGPAGSAPSRSNGVLSHRWTVSDQIDTNLRTTREYHGRLRVASNNLNPNQFRSYVVPPLAQGMRRDSIRFSVAPDGLNLDYQIRDVEMTVSAPTPAKYWEIQHNETVTNSAGAIMVLASCDVLLTADRLTSGGDLITIGMNVLVAKLLNGDRDAGNSVLIESLSVTDYAGPERKVTVSGRVRRNAKVVKNATDAAVFQPWFLGNILIGQLLEHDQVYINPPSVTDPNYDPNRSWGGLTAGDIPSAETGTLPYYKGPLTLLGMFLPYLQTPCSNIHKIVPDGTTLSSDTNESVNPDPETTIQAAVDPGWTESDNPLFSANELAAMYIHWKMESTYAESEMKAALPIANSNYGLSSSTASDTSRVVTLARPQARRIVKIEAERLGAWPEFPSGTQLEAIVGTVSSGGVAIIQTLLKRKLQLLTPFISSGGQKVYTARAKYLFALNRKPEPTEYLAVGRNIWTVDGNLESSNAVTAGWS